MTAAIPLPLRFLGAMALAWCLSACGSSALREAEQHIQRGDHEMALDSLQRQSAAAPQDMALRAALKRQQERVLMLLLAQAEAARTLGQWDVLEVQIGRMEAVDPAFPRLRALKSSLQRARQHQLRVRIAQQQVKDGAIDEARALLQSILAEDPGQPQALALYQGLRQRMAPPPFASPISPAFQKAVSLEFREAPLRVVFEALGRGAGVNFVFDKDVRGDAKVTIMLRDVSLDEAMRVLLSTQQLERKLLNAHSVLIYPSNPAKQREYQELVTRSFYLNNADANKALALVRMMAKTRDLFVDERLNLLVARDTPEVIAMIEQLIAGLDLPEPEVMLEVEVMEIETSRDDAVGLNWPDTVARATTPLSNDLMTPWPKGAGFATVVSNPALVARLRGATGANNLLANPKLRARNKEKARIQIGEKVPVFTSTSTANVGVSTNVNYLDVGLKLEVEPSVQLDNEVIIKVNLEVSSLGSEESSGSGAQATRAYRIGTRNASTSLRLRDGETQVLAGLISDEDRKNMTGIPYLSEAPLLGRLFGVQGDKRKKTEVVLLITPRVLRNIQVPDAQHTVIPSGFDANPGADGLRIKNSGKAAVPLQASASGADGATTQGAGPRPIVTLSENQALVEMSATSVVVTGDTLSVTLMNRSDHHVRGEVQYDAGLFAPAEAGQVDARSGRQVFKLPPQGQQVIVLRVREGAAGVETDIRLQQLQGQNKQGGAVEVLVEGEAHVAIQAP